MARIAWNKIEWSSEMIDYLKANYTLDNQHLADHLGLKKTSVRTKCYELGLYKMQLEYWNSEQVAFLIKNYKTIGDTEIAEIFTENWPKIKGWSKKHIEKKRRYLKLKRTPDQLKNIRENWRKKGLYKESIRKMWETRGSRKLGSIVIWKGEKFIKLSSGYKHLRVFNYKVFKGEIPKGKLVTHIDQDSMNCNPENLQLLTRSQNAIRNRWESYGKYPEFLKIEIRKYQKLKRIINKKIKS